MRREEGHETHASLQQDVLRGSGRHDGHVQPGQLCQQLSGLGKGATSLRLGLG